MIILNRVGIGTAFIRLELLIVRFIKFFMMLTVLCVFVIIFASSMKCAFALRLALFIRVSLVFILFMAIFCLFISTYFVLTFMFVTLVICTY